jgi:hypothetical protein
MAAEMKRTDFMIDAPLGQDNPGIAAAEPFFATGLHWALLVAFE